jgi:hypothetical protein
LNNVQDKLEFFGFLLFPLYIHGIRVSRCITFATLAHATRKFPQTMTMDPSPNGKRTFKECDSQNGRF